MNAEMILQLLILVPVLCAICIVLLRRNPNVREAVTLVFGGVLFAMVVMLATRISWGDPPLVMLAEPFPGLSLALSPEPLGILFALIASFLWPITAIYAIGYMRGHGESNQTRFFACFALSIAATIGISMAANMLTLFVFYELLTLATFPLVTHAGTPDAKRAGRIYLGILMGTSVALMLLATIWTYQITGTLDFTRGGVFPEGTDKGVMSILLLLFIFGTGKAALMPFHRWLPAAMVAPTPVSALLHAVAVVKAGVFTVLKVAIYLFGIDSIADLQGAHFLSYAAAFTILVASIVAMGKDNLKARLAYSTISQLAYIVLGAMIGTSAGVIGGSMHIAMHAFGKITLFFCAGAILVATHRKNVSELDGIGKRMPLTMAAFTIGALSIIGLPPMGGTWSKWMLIQGTLDAGAWILMVVLMISSLLNIAYLLVIPMRAFFACEKSKEDPTKCIHPDARDHTEVAEVDEAPAACLIAIGVTAIGCIALFIFPDGLYQLAQEVAR
ncbi:MAG: proton-conducting transporter membrane subunit [Planctomycetota bacterium]|jgi:multicomponent Na+:H+ antiporter subunit D|nr:proton-conducting transporter membrane subunit [Planctomycetota bacterium]